MGQVSKSRENAQGRPSQLAKAILALGAAH